MNLDRHTSTTEIDGLNLIFIDSCSIANTTTTSKWGPFAAFWEHNLLCDLSDIHMSSAERTG